MSFIDNFLEVTSTLPRKLVRLLKLHRAVELKSKMINDNLKGLREKYLKDLKDNKSDELSLYTNEKYYKELLNLSDYKQSLIEEIKYILDNEFVKKITPIIKEGEKECPEQQSSVSVQYGTNSNYNKTTMEEKNLSINNDKKKNDKLLGNKTNRLKKITTRKGLARVENIEDIPYNAEEDNEIHCICHGTSYGPMIMCEMCEEWFHYSCVGIQEGKEPDHFYCVQCLNKRESNNDNKTSNIENTNHNANNKTKKKEKNNKKKKYNQK